jgi:branched-chain amino acid transport system permease protein
MQQFLQQTINGLSIGGVYALIALGYTMVYGIIKLINFAHGDIFMFGAYVGMIAVMNFNMPIYLAFIIAMAVTALFGVIIERVAYKPLRKSTRTAALITAIGVSFLIQNGVLMIMGANIYAFPQVIPNQFFTVFVFVYQHATLVIFATSIALMIICSLLSQKRSWAGDAFSCC